MEHNSISKQARTDCAIDDLRRARYLYSFSQPIKAFKNCLIIYDYNEKSESSCDSVSIQIKG